MARAIDIDLGVRPALANGLDVRERDRVVVLNEVHEHRVLRLAPAEQKPVLR